ncbi:MAG TPA: hypothetical protein VFG81_10300 [Anaerolineales bacterium]|jgi:hypothetical protein|nr:hypothetical protein [Anaerolineales bacterium]
MKTRIFAQTIVLLIAGSFLLTSCLLPGMIPLNPESTEPAATAEPSGSALPEGILPAMETDSNAVLESLQAREGVYLASLAKERYSEAEANQPGTHTYTVNITDDTPTYFNYGWCTTTEEILRQNFEHIRIGLYINGEALSSNVVHPITYQVDDMVCLDFVALLSNWPNGEYQLRSVATFDEQINDGKADFEAGDYIYEYNVTVDK